MRYHSKNPLLKQLLCTFQCTTMWQLCHIIVGNIDKKDSSISCDAYFLEAPQYYSFPNILEISSICSENFALRRNCYPNLHHILANFQRYRFLESSFLPKLFDGTKMTSNFLRT